MNIGYFADGPWSHNAFEKIINSGLFNIRFICARFDSVDETLLNYSREYNISYFKVQNINDASFIQTVKSFNCDLLVSMSFNQIFKSEIINLTSGGIINCHAGKLPFYRGRNILNWALINDEKEFGITVHYVDTGIDTGDIILQRTFPITDESNYGSLLNVSYIACADILFDALVLLKEGKAQRHPQSVIHEVGFYCSKREPGDEILNWSQSSRDIFNFVRAISYPGPMATSFCNGQFVKINKLSMVPGAPSYKGTCGQILAKTKTGFLIKTLDSFVEINEHSTENNFNLKVGDRLVPIKDSYGK